MLACLDVDYRPNGSAVAACLGFEAWTSPRATNEWIARVPTVAPYEPGALYRRELPCLLAALEEARRAFDVIVVDAYVTLDASGAPGLGAHLYAALHHLSWGARSIVVGVAKTAYATAKTAIPVLRGESKRPLWVSAAGMDPTVAAAHVAAMHGASRIPTLLRDVDRAARTR